MDKLNREIVAVQLVHPIRVAGRMVNLVLHDDLVSCIDGRETGVTVSLKSGNDTLIPWPNIAAIEVD